MSDVFERVMRLASDYDKAAVKSIVIDPLIIEEGAIARVAPYLMKQEYKSIVIAADEITYRIAGQKVEIAAGDLGLTVHTEIILPDKLGDVIADEASVVQLLLAIQRTRAEVVVAAGSGTIHDIARYAAYTAGIPFVSVPTAPSVDGFNSKGAPLILRGEKKTIAAIGPDALFADLELLTQAPPAMVAAGFGDMLGKYTSLMDWRFGSLEGGEPYSEPVAAITRQALLRCVEHVEDIAARTSEGISILMESLIESGLAMLLFIQSHPASGAEHHLSHYWEMAFIREGRRALLHGAKVGVACAEVTKLYKELALRQDGLAFTRHPEQVSQLIAELPEEEQIRTWLRLIGGPGSIEELGIEKELFTRSIAEAHHVRPNRYTLLRAYNERGQ